jgi:hypothetical protein
LFEPSLQEATSGLIELMEEANTLEAKNRIDDVLNTLIGQMGIKVNMKIFSLNAILLTLIYRSSLVQPRSPLLFKDSVSLSRITPPTIVTDML